jgi:hypothetical protein
MSPQRLLLAVLLATLQPAAALADDALETTTYTFDGELVAGDTSAPTLTVLHVRAKKARESLIRVREHFIAELCESVENL